MVRIRFAAIVAVVAVFLFDRRRLRLLRPTVEVGAEAAAGVRRLLRRQPPRRRRSAPRQWTSDLSK